MQERNIVERALTEAGKTKEIGSAGTAKAKQNMLELIELEQRAGELDEPRESRGGRQEGLTSTGHVSPIASACSSRPQVLPA